MTLGCHVAAHSAEMDRSYQAGRDVGSAPDLSAAADRIGQRGHQLIDRLQGVAADYRVDVRPGRRHSGRERLVGGALGPRVHPHDAERDQRQPLHLPTHHVRVAGVPAIGNDQHHGAPGHAATAVVVVELLQRRAEPGPAMPVRRGLGGPASATAGVDRASAAVSRVSRVANVNTSASAPPAAQYSSWIMARAYGSIDPEMSQSTTRRRGRLAGTSPISRKACPPVRRAWRRVERMSVRLPPGAACGAATGGWDRERDLAHAAASSASSAADSSAKSVPASRSAGLPRYGCSTSSVWHRRCSS